MATDGLLHFSEFELQIIALSIFALLYGIRVSQVMKLPLPKETAPPKGNHALGVAVSFGGLFYPCSIATYPSPL